MEPYLIEYETTNRKSKDFLTKNQHLWNISKQLRIEDLMSRKEFNNFEYAGKIISADTASKYKIITEPKFEDLIFLVYILVINGYVVKGGKCKSTLDTRSYSAGTEKSWTMTGEPSPTNYVFSQIFRAILPKGAKIEFYAYVSNIQPVSDFFLGETRTSGVSQYESLEKYLKDYLDLHNNKKVIGEGNLLAKYKD
jgi:hypothetical protein